MSSRWVFVGELGANGALDWGGPPGGNVPRSGMLPDLYYIELYLLVRSLATEGRYNGRTVDWDASAIRVNGTQLKEVLHTIIDKKAGTHVAQDIVEYLDFAERLGCREVALVAVAF